MAIEQNSQKHAVGFLCEIAGVSRSGYYRYLKSREKVADLDLRKLIREICESKKRIYGYRRVTVILEKRYGLIVNHKKVYRLMKEMNLLAVIRRKKTWKTYGHERADLPNVLNRDFVATKPAEKWVTDITEFHIGKAKVYLSAVMDLFNNEIVAYHISRHPDLELVSETIARAIQGRDVRGLTLHSDQGGQYAAKSFGALLKNFGIIQSMSRRGNCLDNACIESFFGHLKCEMWHSRKYRSVAELYFAINDYIRFYNTERIQAGLQKMTPVEYGSHHMFCA